MSSEIAKKRLVSLLSETEFFGCETKLYEAKNTENTVPKIPKISKHFLQNGLKKQPDIQGCLDEATTKEIND